MTSDMHPMPPMKDRPFNGEFTKVISTPARSRKALKEIPELMPINKE